MKYFHFRQNNSGGSFVINQELNKNVFIQANSAKEANAIALDLGIYFNGVGKGIDCDCCGDRWYECSEDDFDAVEKVEWGKYLRPHETVIHHNKNYIPELPITEHRRLEV